MDKYLFSIHSFSRSFSHSSGDDITSIQQEITMMKECKHKNIVAYYGTYHRYSNVCTLPGISPVVVRAEKGAFHYMFYMSYAIRNEAQITD